MELYGALGGSRELYGALWGAMGRGGADLSDVLPHILDDHLVGRDGLHGKQPPFVDAAPAEPQPLLTELWGTVRAALWGAHWGPHRGTQRDT